MCCCDCCFLGHRFERENGRSTSLPKGSTKIIFCEWCFNFSHLGRLNWSTFTGVMSYVLARKRTESTRQKPTAKLRAPSKKQLLQWRRLCSVVRFPSNFPQIFIEKLSCTDRSRMKWLQGEPTFHMGNGWVGPYHPGPICSWDKYICRPPHHCDKRFLYLSFMWFYSVSCNWGGALASLKYLGFVRRPAKPSR